MSDESDDHEDEDDRSTVSNPFSEVAERQQAMAEAFSNIYIPPQGLRKALEATRMMNQTQLAALNAIDFDAISKAATVSINPAIFQIVEAQNSALEDMYRVVAAAQQIEAEATPEEDDEPDVAEGSEISDSIESTFYELVATFASDEDSQFPRPVRASARAVLYADDLSSKKDYFNEIFAQADEGTRNVLLYVTSLAVQAVFALIMIDYRRDE